MCNNPKARPESSSANGTASQTPDMRPARAGGGALFVPTAAAGAAADDHDCVAAEELGLAPGLGTQESTSHAPDGARVSESRNTIGESASPRSGIT